MTLSYSRDQVLALAPDAASVKAAQKLLSVGKWSLLAHDPSAVWGECQGSGKKPYLVQVDRNGPAFKCSCPSRKFPCKHGLALMLLLADQPAAFREAEAPARVTDWLEARQDTAKKKVERARAQAEKPVDPKAQARRVKKRWVEMAAGLDDFELWLRDLVRQGLAALPGRDADFWSEPAARLVDAKAPGLANWVRALQKVVRSAPDGWQRRVMAMAGQAYLLLRAFRRFDELTPEEQADVRTALGWAVEKEAVLAGSNSESESPGEGLREPMAVLGSSLTVRDRLRELRLWLRGTQTGRDALVLEFAYGRQPFELTWTAGTVQDLDLAFYPSRSPLRALVKERHGDARPVDGLVGTRSIDTALDQAAERLAANPWIGRQPMGLCEVRLVPGEDRWRVVDGRGRCLGLHPKFKRSWELLAMSGGGAVDVFGEWRDEGFLPLSTWSDEGFRSLPHEEME
ncbi:MAG: SWIM zinc finger family protein [Thermoanaerobaculia bacterium]|nr:SWIM zinc finger family protein [Thermoanaerobaculia bacterium]